MFTTCFLTAVIFQKAEELPFPGKALSLPDFFLNPGGKLLYRNRSFLIEGMLFSLINADLSLFLLQIIHYSFLCPDALLGALKAQVTKNIEQGKRMVSLS